MLRRFAKPLFQRNTLCRLFSTQEPSSPVFNKIACIGGGMMSQAMIEPLIEKNLQPPDRFMVYDVNVKTLQKLREQYGVSTASTVQQCIADAELVLLAVKPQNLTHDFFREIAKVPDHDSSILLSVVAGKSMDFFRNAGGFRKIVRSMPNTPATIGEGMTVWSATQNLTVEERTKIELILGSCGSSMYVDDETFIDMATSISGSGPAYIFMLMESMIDAGVHMGFPRDKATTLVYQTMLGSTLYAMKSGEHPAILRNRVTSPSGTTASALYELEAGKFRTVIKGTLATRCTAQNSPADSDAMWACYRRSREMGNIDSNVGPGRTTTGTDIGTNNDK